MPLALGLPLLFALGAHSPAAYAQSAKSAQPAGSIPASELVADLERLGQLPKDSLAEAEIALAAKLAGHPARALAVYARQADDPRRALLLRLFTLAGSPAFLGVVHEELQRAGAGDLLIPALTAAVTFSRPESAPFIRPFLRDIREEVLVLTLTYFQRHPQRLLPGDLAAVRGFGREDGHQLTPVMTALLGVWGARAQNGDESARAPCAKALAHPATPVRVQAVRCLGKLGQSLGEKMQPSSVLPALAWVLISPFEGAPEAQQVESIKALKMMGAKVAVKPSLKWLRHGNARVALMALIALQELNARQAVPELMDLIENGGANLPTSVLIKSLGLYRDPQSLAFLGMRLEAKGGQGGASGADPGGDPEIKAATIEAIGDLGLLEGQRYLQPYLADYNPDLRKAAILAVRKIAARQLRER